MHQKVQQLLLINALSNRATSNINVNYKRLQRRSTRNIRPFARWLFDVAQTNIICRYIRDISPELYLVCVAYIHHQNKRMHIYLIR